jgi:hypothetical protein
MSLTGPVVPKRYYLSNTASPAGEPVAVDAVNGEILVCAKTGRMWINNNGTIRGIRFEHRENTTLYGDTVAGIDGYLEGTSFTGTAGVRLYGTNIKLDGNTVVPSTGGFTCNGNFGVSNAFPISISSTATGAANSILIESDKPTLKGVGNTHTIWASAVANQFFEIAAQSVGSGFDVITYFKPSEVEMKKVLVATAGIRATTLPSRYALSTDSSGNLQTFTPTYAASSLGTDYTISAINTDEELTALAVTLGAAGQTHHYRIDLTVIGYHNGNHDLQVKLRNKTSATDLFGTQVSGSGWTTQTRTIYVSTTAATQFGVYVKSGHTAAIKAANGSTVPATTLSYERIG